MAVLSNDSWLAHWRHLEIDHPLLCFFFISTIDEFTWRKRLFCLLMEQAINFSCQVFFALIVLSGSSSCFSVFGILGWLVFTCVFVDVSLGGGAAPNPGGGLLLFSLMAWVAALPYRQLRQAVSGLCALRPRALTPLSRLLA